jgi:NAD+ kinase
VEEARAPARRQGPGDAAGNPDLIVTLGGDGTFLRGARIAAKNGAAVLGVDLGKVGFLTEVPVEDVEEALESVHHGGATIEERMMLTLRASRTLEIPPAMEALLHYGRGPVLPPPAVRPESTEG